MFLQNCKVIKVAKWGWSYEATFLPGVILILKQIDEHDKSPAGAKAQSLLKAANQFEYLFVIYALQEILIVVLIFRSLVKC